MSENINPTGAIARNAINMNISEDVVYWTSKFNVSREQLQLAVDRVGNKETRVLDYLRAKGVIRF